MAVTMYWLTWDKAEYVEGFLEGSKDDNSTTTPPRTTRPMYEDAACLVFEFGKADYQIMLDTLLS